MNKDDQIRYWLEGAERDMQSAKRMAVNKHNDWALFVGQLALEKLLKGLIINKTNDHPPMIHNLVKLVEVAGLDLDDNQKRNMNRISAFNLEARYAETKLELYKLATPEFTNKWMAIIEEFYKWIKSHY